MTGPTAKPLNGKQMKALSALLCSPTLAAAAKLSGIPERSLYRYLRTPHFADAYRRARTEQVRQSMCHLQRMTTKAAATLETLLGDPVTKGAVKVAAARTVLDLSLRAIEIEDLEARLTALEAQTEAG